MRYKIPGIVPLLNPLMRRLIGLGLRLGPRRAPMVLLTVRGRRTGKPRTTAVNMFIRRDTRYVLGTFGETDWVRNLRVAGEATLTEGGRRSAVEALELPIEDAAGVLRDALRPFLRSRLAAPALRRFYDLTADAPFADFAAEARHHPIFELRPRIA